MIELLAAAGLLLSSGAGAGGPVAAPAPTDASASPPGAPTAAPSPGQERAGSDARRARRDTLSGTIRGRVLGRESGEPLSFVVVEVGSGDEYRATRTGENGRYVLDDVPPGRRNLRARALDRHPLELTIKVPPRRTVQLDLSLSLRPVGLPLLQVMGLSPWNEVDLRSNRELTPGSPAAAEMKALEASPGVAELGLAEQTRTTPGGRPTDPGSTLYVRGATSDLKMVLLDGAPVYAPFHLGGLMEALQPGVIDSSRVYVGGAPARYNGGLSYIMDLATRPGDRKETSARGSVDLLGARTQVEGPVGPGAYYVGVRGLHGLGSRGLTGASLPYGYGDVLARVDMPFSSSDRLAVTGFFNRESVDLEPEVGFEGSVHWGNRAGSVRYQRETEDGEVRFVLSGGQFRTRLPVTGDPAHASRGRTNRARFGIDVARRVDEARVQFGGSFDHYGVGYRRGRPGLPAELAPRRHSTGDMLGAYSDVVLPVTEALSVRGGVRGDLFLTEIEPRLSPRLTVALDVGERSVLSVRAGRYHQYVRSPEAVVGSDLDAFTGGGSTRTPIDTELHIASASHLVVGLDHKPQAGLRLGAEAFYKSFQNVPRNNKLRSSGLDLWADYRGDEWAAWGGYGLAFVWSRTGDARFREDFVGRHLFSGGLRAPLPSDIRLEVEVSSSAGLPFTPIPTPVEPPTPDRAGAGGQGFSGLAAAESDGLLPGALQGSYLRVDAKLSRSWPIRLLDSEVRLTPYLQVLNALDRRDALFYQFDPNEDLEPNSLSAVPLLPVAGVEWRL